MKDMDPVKEIATVIVAVSNDDSLSVRLDDSGMACIDWEKKRITISDRAVPKAYRVHPALTRLFRLRFAQHEAQHWMFLKDIVRPMSEWIDSRQFPQLARDAINIVEDYRVNTWLEETYSYDIGRRITWTNALFLKAWKPQLAKLLRTAVKKNDTKFLNEPVNFVLHASIQCGILGVDVKDFSEQWAMWTGMYPAEGAIKSVERIVEVTRESRYVSQDAIFETWQEVYRLMESHVRERWEKQGDGNVKVVPGPPTAPNQATIPIMFGGTLEVEGSKADVDKEAQKIAEAEGKVPEESLGDQYQAHAGKGPGAEVPTPRPDEARYSELVRHNQPYITSLLNKLKTLMQPVVETMKYQKSGRLMSKQLGKYVTSRRPVENLYSRKKFTLEEQEVAMALVVDLSGSMSTEAVRNVLTVIAEVGGQWLDDSDFSIFVFGSGFQKVKTFDETYHNARYRIGGVKNLGGTMLAHCLTVVHRMFQTVDDSREKICIVVSDFAIGDSKGTLKAMREMRKDGVTFIGVGMCASDLESVKAYTLKNSTFINDISELPNLFYEIYRKASKRA